MHATILDAASRALAAPAYACAPLYTLLANDAFCTALMALRATQGWKIPAQDPSLAPSGRLAYLHALAAGSGVADARARCDGTATHQHRLDTIRSAVDLDAEMRALLIQSLEALLHPKDLPSQWPGLYLLLGGERIRQEAIPLYEEETTPAQAVEVVRALLQCPPEPAVTIGDTHSTTGAKGFIRLGANPSHFGFPETADTKTGTNAAIFHYELSHPGGEVLFFSTRDVSADALGDHIRQALEDCPLYINDLHQMMAVNSYCLQSLGIACVPAGDTQVTLLKRGEVITGAVTPDYRPDAEAILSALTERGATGKDRAAIGAWLRQEEPEGDEDHDWDLLKNTAARHPDLLGHWGMGMEESRIFIVPKATLRQLALRLHAGDHAAAEAEMAEVCAISEAVEMPAGTLHLYVPNLASEKRYDQAGPALNACAQREDREIWLTLSTQPLDLGDDPHTCSTMRRAG